MKAVAPYVVALGALLAVPNVQGWVFLAVLLVFFGAICVALAQIARCPSAGTVARTPGLPPAGGPSFSSVSPHCKGAVVVSSGTASRVCDPEVGPVLPPRTGPGRPRPHVEHLLATALAYRESYAGKPTGDRYVAAQRSANEREIDALQVELQALDVSQTGPGGEPPPSSGSVCRASGASHRAASTGAPDPQNADSRSTPATERPAVRTPKG